MQLFFPFFFFYEVRGFPKNGRVVLGSLPPPPFFSFFFWWGGGGGVAPVQAILFTLNLH